MWPVKVTLAVTRKKVKRRTEPVQSVHRMTWWRLRTELWELPWMGRVYHENYHELVNRIL